jgi:vacuolar iron transporter family protein
MTAAVTAGLCYGVGAAIPLAAMRWLPLDDRLALTFITVLAALGLTGWLTGWLTGLSVFRLIRRNLVVGSAIMAAGILAGHVLH